MCGLFGALSSRLKADDVECVQHLGIVSTIRGHLGAGVAIVQKKPKADDNIITLKNSTLSAAEMMISVDFWKETNKKSLSCIMGHARHPTSGTTDTSHCHPFIADHITGVHNGTLSVVDGQKVKDKDSDSELLFKAIAKRGIEPVLNQTEGSYALVYIDKRAKTINFIRNDRRTIYFANFKEAPQTLYWASEHGMLEFVLGRVPGGTVQFWRIQPGYLHSFNLFFEGDVAPISTKQILKPPTSVPVTGQGRSQSDYGSSRYLTLNPITVTYDELMGILNSGCEMCRHSATIDDYRQGKLTFCTSDTFVCRECTDTDETARAWVQSCGVTPPQRSN
jgi:predicted glutamine amidotransferase